MIYMFPSQKMLKILLCVIIFINISGIGGALVADRDVIIGFHQKPGQSEKLLVTSHGGTVKNVFHLVPAIAARIPETERKSIKNDSRVRYIEDDVKFNMTVDEYSNSWGVQHIGSQLVHNSGFTGTGIKIAVLDTGIDYNHEDLRNNYKGGYDFVNNDPDPWDDNCLTEARTCHGTHVSGIIAAGHNGIGVIGVAPNASIYAVKVIHASGGSAASWIIAGLQWAVDNNMNIATMSVG